MADDPVVETDVVGEDVRSPRALLIEWANNSDGWVRLVVADVLATTQPLSDSAVRRLYETYKSEKGLSEEKAFSSPKLEIDEVNGNGETVLVLRSLDEVHGVNALEEGHAITFNEHLTVLFGENGTGKTGYSRILKRVAKVRTAEPVLPNAHAPGTQLAPTARIRYSLGSASGETIWQNEEGVAPFSRLGVFDWLSVTVHLDTELGYLYTPADLSLFTHISDGIERIQELLTAETDQLRPGPNPFVRHFERGTVVYPLIESLGSATDLDAVTQAAKVKAADRKRAEQLNEEIVALKGRALDDQLFAASERARGLRLLSEAARKATAFDAGAYETARKALNAAEAEHKRARAELFDAELPGPPDDEWQEFIAASDAYLEHRGLDHYPDDGAKCIYCRQQLSEEASNLIKRYRLFLDGSLARHLSSTTRLVREQALSLDGLDLGGIKKFIALFHDQPASPKWLDLAERTITQMKKVAQETERAAPAGARGLTTDGSKLLESVSDELDSALEAEKQLQAKRADRADALSASQDELAELQARIDLAKQLTAVRVHVNDSKTYEQFQTLSKRIPVIRRSLTEVAKVASQDLVNSSFSKLFAEECEALRAPSIQLHFQGRRGKAERRKTVASTYRPSEILSEGEQKVLALADFLAECRMRGTRAPIIFDDPVTSLDYRRLGEVAERISKLAETHQVIVFTHNIWFTTELLALFEKRKGQISYYAVRDNDDAKGIIVGGDSPRQDNPKTIGKRMDTVISAANKAEPTAQDALIEKGYDHLRTWMEAFVEQEMLGGITGRYRPNVMMGRLNKLRPDKLTNAIDKINPLFDKACRYMGGHSQPLEQLSVRPTLKDLEEDWAALQELRRDFT